MMFVHILAWWVSAEDRRSIKRTLSCLTTMVHRYFNKNQSYWLWLLLGLNGYELPHRRYQSAFERDILLVVSVEWVIFFCGASPFTSLIFFSPSEMTRVVYSYVYFYSKCVAVLQTLHSNTPLIDDIHRLRSFWCSCRICFFLLLYGTTKGS